MGTMSKAALAACGVLIAAVWKGRSAGEKKLDFVNCDIMEDRLVHARPCGPNVLVPSLWTSYYYDAVLARATEIRAAGSTPAVLHIGASEFSTDRLMYRPLLQKLQAATLPTRLVLVEPQADLVPTIRRHAATLPLGEGQLHVANVAVDPDCTGEPLRMYGWSKRILEHFLRPDVPLQGFVSSRREHPVYAARGSAYNDPSNPFRDEWRRVADFRNLSDYVEEIRFRCDTVPGLLSTVEAAAGDVAFLVVDAEGMDCGILLQFLRLEGFRPAFVMIEAQKREPKLRLIWPQLKERGYLVGMTSGGQNVIAVDARLYQMPLPQRLVHWMQPLMPCQEFLCWP